MAEESFENRLASLEHSFKILLALILISLSASLVSLLLALVTLITS